MEYQFVNNEQLVEDLTAGSGEAWELAWEYFMESPAVKKAHRYIVRKCNGYDLEAITGLFNEKLWRSLSRLVEKGEAPRELEAFVMQIAVWECNRHLKTNLSRKERISRLNHEDASWLIKPDDTSGYSGKKKGYSDLPEYVTYLDHEDCIFSRIIVQKLKADEKIKEIEWQIIYFYYYENMQDEQIAAALNMKRDTVKSHRRRGLQKLKAAVA